MPQIQLFTELEKNFAEIGIFPVTGLDIEADLRSASFVIEADLLVLKPISTVLKPI